MHIGQALNLVAGALAIPEPTMKMVGRIIRDNGYVNSGPRGRNAPHMTFLEVARMIIAATVSESPAQGVDRLPHYAALPLVTDHGPEGMTFEKALALLLERLAEEDSATIYERRWTVEINVTYSWAVIETSRHETDRNSPEMHIFSENDGGDLSKPWIDQIKLPYFSPVERTVKLSFLPLAVIAKGLVGEEHELEDD